MGIEGFINAIIGIIGFTTVCIAIGLSIAIIIVIANGIARLLKWITME